jgi:acetyl esterase/lipase
VRKIAVYRLQVYEYMTTPVSKIGALIFLKTILLFILVINSTNINSQQFLPLWNSNKIPNSKGIAIKDSISDERYRRVGNPGLLVFLTSKQENKNTAVIICPGGGYKHLSYEVSGVQIAKWFNTMGINAFVLISRLPLSPDLVHPEQAPLQDAQRAIRLIRYNAPQWKIDVNKIGVIGFSAGGHIASSLGTHTEDISAIRDKLDSVSFRPDFMILVSPVITMGEYTHKGSRDNLLGTSPSKDLTDKYSNELQVSDKTPPAFIALADNDKSVNPLNSLLFYQALHKKNISASLHIFPWGGHNLALRNNPGSTQDWTQLCEKWLIEMKFL